MSYQIEAIFQVLHSTDRAAQTLATQAFEAFGWSSEVVAGDALAGSCNTDSGLRLEKDRLILLIDRELYDDLDCLSPRLESSDRDLRWHLEHQFFLEIEGKIESSLRLVGLMLLGGRPTAAHLGEEEQQVFNAAVAKWEAERESRRETLDLEAYARVLARRGRSPERGWPDTCQQAYEKALRLRLREKLAAITSLCEQGAPLAEIGDVLEETSTMLATAHL